MAVTSSRPGLITRVRADGELARGLGGRFLKWLGWAVLALYCVTSVFALVWMTYGAFKSQDEWLMSGLSLPHQLQWSNFVNAWNDAEIGRFFFNSVYISLISLVGSVSLSALAAYVIARVDFWGGVGNKIALYYALAALMVPGFLYLVPLYFTMKDFGLVNSHVGLILLYIHGGLAFDIFILTGFYKTLPTEIEEAASLDGASAFQTFVRVMLPLASPGLVTVAIFNFIGDWNEFFYALVFLRDRSLDTISVGLWSLLGGYIANYGILFAGITIMILPMLVVFAVLQDRITEGLTVGAIKG